MNAFIKVFGLATRATCNFSPGFIPSAGATFLPPQLTYIRHSQLFMPVEGRVIERPAAANMVVAIHILQDHTLMRPDIVLKPGVLVCPGDFPTANQHDMASRALCPYSRIKEVLQVVTEHKRRATP